MFAEIRAQAKAPDADTRRVAELGDGARIELLTEVALAIAGAAASEKPSGPAR